MRTSKWIHLQKRREIVWEKKSEEKNYILEKVIILNR